MRSVQKKESLVAESLGETSNRFDEFFAELERWEEVLSMLGDLPVDCSESIDVPPG